MTNREYAEKQIEIIDKFIKNYFVENGNPGTKAVIGISGGKDSTVAAALLVGALGPERVVGVLMPCGKQADIDDSREVCELLGITAYEIDIGPACSALYSAIDEGYDYDHCCHNNSAVATNTPSRIRMATLYAIAAMVGGRVCNTGNRSEAFIGYTTKYGDLAGDFALLKGLTVREILEIGDVIDLPHHLVHKLPADGMSGKTDEDNTGIPYSAIDDYLLENVVPEMSIFEKMMYKHKINEHKKVVDLPYPKVERRYIDIDEGWCF
jgi:NAD+ synthase